nr:hypothetical protein AAX72_01825 [Levilactobacillus brevis]
MQKQNKVTGFMTLVAFLVKTIMFSITNLLEYIVKLPTDNQIQILTIAIVPLIVLIIVLLVVYLRCTTVQKNKKSVR